MKIIFELNRYKVLNPCKTLTPSSLLSNNGASLRNPFLSYQRWFYFCLFLLEQFNSRGFSLDKKAYRCFSAVRPLSYFARSSRI